MAILHPGWDRSCATCERYRPREDGSFVLDRRTALPLLRVPGTPTPCHKCPKVPAAVRASGADWRELRKHACELSEADRKAWAFYRRCRAVGRFPEDPLVDWYSSVLRDVYDGVDLAERAALRDAIERLTAKLAEGRR